MISHTLDLVLAGYVIAGLIYLLAMSIYIETWCPNGIKVSFWGLVFSHVAAVAVWPVYLVVDLRDMSTWEQVSVFLTKRISFKKKHTPDIERRK
jgi:hypothetical protein